MWQDEETKEENIITDKAKVLNMYDKGERAIDTYESYGLFPHNGEVVYN